MINGMILILKSVLDGDVPRRSSYVVYISPLIHFARTFSHVNDLNTRNEF